MIPVDSADIQKDYQILLNELEQYNPELLDKDRLLALTKSDMIDKELMKEMKAGIPDISYVFISSITGQGIQQLKDMLWNLLNSNDVS